MFLFMKRKLKVVDRTIITVLGTLLIVAAPTMGQAQESADNRSILEEIIVTAQRREQSLMDVPMSATLVSNEAMEDFGIEDSHDLQFAIPGLSFQSISGTSQVTLRGVGTSYSGPALGNSISLYLDDAYITNQIGAITTFYDMNSVEVLKGPQSVLYGRNSTGGTILFKTKDPILGETEAYVQAGVGEQDSVDFEGAINIPLGESAAIRLSAKMSEYGEYVTNVNNGDEIGARSSEAYRIKFLFEPNDRLRIVAKYEYQMTEEDDEPLRRQTASGLLCRFCVGGDDGDALGFYETAQTPVALSEAAIIAGFGYNPLSGDTLVAEITVDHLALNIDWQISDALRLTSVSAFRDVERNGGQDQDASFIDDIVPFGAKSLTPGDGDGIDYESTTQELRLTSTFDGPFNFTAGYSYSDDDNLFVFGVGGGIFNALRLGSANFDDLESNSFYVDGYFEVNDQLTITAGVRRTEDEIVHSWRFPTDGTKLTQNVDYEKTSWRIAIDYQFSDRAMGYIAFNDNFKSGGYNSPAFGQQTPVEPEEIEAWEIGAKFSPTDFVAIETAYFHYEWENMHVAVISGTAGIDQQNAAAAEADGFELSFRFVPNANWNVGVAMLWLDSEFSSFRDASQFAIASAITPGARGLIGGTPMDLTGYRTPNSPDFSLSADLTYDFVINSVIDGSFTAMLSYKDDYDTDPGAGGPARLAKQESTTVGNLNLEFRHENGWAFSLYADNFTDEEYVFESTTIAGGGYMSQALPRVVGARLRYDF